MLEFPKAAVHEPGAHQAPPAPESEIRSPGARLKALFKCGWMRKLTNVIRITDAARPHQARAAVRPRAKCEIALGLQRDPQRSVNHQRGQRGLLATEDGVPIQNAAAGVLADGEIGSTTAGKKCWPGRAVRPEPRCREPRRRRSPAARWRARTRRPTTAARPGFERDRGTRWRIPRRIKSHNTIINGR